jgi:AraC-like DNA-binding protein
MVGIEVDPEAGSGAGRGGGQAAVQVLQFATDAFRERERIAAWREVFGRTLLNIDIAPASKDGFQASAAIFCSPTLGLLRASTAPARQGNSRSLITNDDVTFSWPISSRLSASKLGRSVDLCLGDGVLMSNGDVGEMAFPEACRYVAFRVPRSALAPLVSDIGGLIARRVPAANPAMRMLARHVDLGEADLIAADVALQAAFANHVCDLLALALGATRDAAEQAQARGLPAARLRAMKDDIRKSCRRPDLTVRAVAARYSVSARYVQRLFEESGSTFTQYLTEQRLAAAYNALRRSASAGAAISTIAYDCGFSDVSHFNRLFRRRFGCTPTDLRKTLRPEANQGRD